jgi:hypothetical protein
MNEEGRQVVAVERSQRHVFYKYMSARVAAIVLATRKLRYSSPLQFNDPFDVTQELRLNFDEGTLGTALTARVTWLIENAGLGTPISHPFFGPLVAWAAKQPVETRRKLANRLRPGVIEPTPGQTQALQLLRETWSVLVPNFRVLCLSEAHDVAPMWNHYADKYQGVVLEFFAVAEIDSVFQVARPVVYQDVPSMADVNAWVRCMLGEGDARWQDLFLEYLYVKTPDWSYEKEWRVPVPARRPDDSDLFGDYGFHPRELTGIYFGPKCSDHDREDLLKLLVHGLEHVKAYQMGFDTQHAKLVARPIER